jgi:hypothetical protein
LKRIILVFILLMTVCLTGFAAPSQEEVDARNILDDLKSISLRLENPTNFNEFSTYYNNIYIKVRKFDTSYPSSVIRHELGNAFIPYYDAYGIWKRPYQGSKNKYRWANWLRPKEVEYLQGQYEGMKALISSNLITTLDDGNMLIGSETNDDSIIVLLFTTATERIKPLEGKINQTYIKTAN